MMCYSPSVYIIFNLRKLKSYEGRGLGARCEDRGWGADNPNTQNITSFCVLAAFEAMHFSWLKRGYVQKESFAANLQNGVLKNFANFAGKQCFPIKFVKFSRTLIFTEHLQWSLASVINRAAVFKMIGFIFWDKLCLKIHYVL